VLAGQVIQPNPNSNPNPIIQDLNSTPLKLTMPRRPPPSALRLHPGPTPPRSWLKHTLPSLPRPAFYPPKLALPDRVALVPESTTQSRSSSPVDSSSSSRRSSIDQEEEYQQPQGRILRGPWDRSRNFAESTVDVSGLVRAPKRAAVTVGNAVPDLNAGPFW